MASWVAASVGHGRIVVGLRPIAHFIPVVLQITSVGNLNSYSRGIQLSRIHMRVHLPVDQLLTTSTMSNKVRPQNWKALAPPIPNFAHQSSTLPRLPLPPLETTLQRLKGSLRPLARSTEEFDSICRKIDDFGCAGGPGPVLQQILIQRKNEADSWLEELWDDFAFLSARSCVSF